MSTWQGRGMASGPGGGKPRFGPLWLALPFGIFLIFNAVTGRIDLTSAFTGDNAVERWLDQKAVIEATVEARRTAEQDANAAPVNAVASPTGPAGVSNATCEPAEDEHFCLYTVQPGDSLAAIAARFDLDGGAVPGWELIFHSNRPAMASVDEILQPGLTLRIPRSEGILHIVMPGDSVSRLAQDYGVTTQQIADANDLLDANNVQIGDILLVPSPNQVPLPELPSPDADEPEDDAEQGEEHGDESVEDGDTGDSEEESAEGEDGAESESGEPEDAEAGPEDSPGGVVDDDGEDEPSQEESDGSDADGEENDDSEQQEGEDPGDSGDSGEEDANADEDAGEGEEGQDGESEPDGDEAEAEEQEAEAEPDDPAHMSWPVVQVKITNYMTARHPLGIDLGLAAAPGSPITAAAGGKVIFAGGNSCCSYGLYVIVEHTGGLQTLYAHLSSISVSKGETVARGQTLGIAGATGYARGIHLHFEVYKDGKRVDPMNYLPQ